VKKRKTTEDKKNDKHCQTRFKTGKGQDKKQENKEMKSHVKRTKKTV